TGVQTCALPISTLVSFPRDLIVTTPDYPNGIKINAVYASGKGPRRLVKTIEQVTNLRIDHYAEIGLGGFATMVDAIGGVEMTIPKDMVDGSNGQKLKAGTYKLNGAQALTFVRMRKGEATPRSDLVRPRGRLALTHAHEGQRLRAVQLVG